MVFDLNGKVALITGSASGIGLQYAKELLRSGNKGVALVDMNETAGQVALQDLENEFGKNKAIFLLADVRSTQQLEDAFKKTVEVFGNIDIVINNAGILNDQDWQDEISVNVNGVINGILLGIEKYLPKYRRGSEALIVNTASVAGIIGYDMMPIYCSTKHAVIGMTLSWGDATIFEKVGVRIIAICPGLTVTPMIHNIRVRNLGGLQEEQLRKILNMELSQSPESVAKESIELFKRAPTGSIWIIECGEPAYRFIFPNKDEMKMNVISLYD